MSLLVTPTLATIVCGENSSADTPDDPRAIINGWATLWDNVRTLTPVNSREEMARLDERVEVGVEADHATKSEHCGELSVDEVEVFMEREAGGRARRAQDEGINLQCQQQR